MPAHHNGPVSSNVRPQCQYTCLHREREKMNHKIVLAITIALWFNAANSTCFTITDQANRTIYQSHMSPVDLSKSISEEIARVYPGGHLVTSIYECNSDGHSEEGEYEVWELLHNTYSSTNASPRRRSGISVTGVNQYSGSRSTGIGRTAGTDVTVRSYQRNGQTVQGHTRAGAGQAR